MVKAFFFDNNSEFSSNTYIIGEKNGPCILVDIGSTSDEVLNYIEENHTACFGILLTHGHYDHIRGINKILDKYNATIFVTEEDYELLDDIYKNCSYYCNEEVKINRDLPHYILEDEDEINFFNKYYVKVIKTPFHTLGSCCFVIDRENSIFTGDTLFRGSIGRYDLPTSNSDLIKESLNKLISIKKDYTVYPGHGSTTTLNYEKNNNYYLKEIKMINVTELRPGNYFEDGGNIYLVLDILLNKTAMRKMVAKVKVKNLRSGAITEMSANSGYQVDTIRLDKKKMSYLYDNGDFLVFMDQETYEQIELDKKRLEWELKFLTEGLEVEIVAYNDEILGINLPSKVALKITHTEPAVKGDSVNKAMKDATLETGHTIKVPLFIDQDEVVLVRTDNGDYDGRA